MRLVTKRNSQDWAEAKKRCRLNVSDIQMAKELGMTPKSLLKNIPASHQQWKAPVKVWIRDLYEEKFGRIHTVMDVLSKETKSKAKKQEKRIVTEHLDDKKELPF